MIASSKRMVSGITL